MNKMKKLLLTAILLVIVGVLGCLLTFKEMTHADVIHEEKYMDMPFSKVQLDVDNAQINIKPTKDKNAKVVLTGKGKASRVDFSYGVKDANGSTLFIKLKETHPDIFSFDFFARQLTLDVYLPEKQYDSMVISNHNGKVNLAHLKTTNLTATTNNGLISLKNMATNKVNVKTNNGKILMDYVGGEIKGTADNGEISVITKDLDHPINLSCDNGRIRIQTDKVPTNVTFVTHVDNGKINILNKYNSSAVIGNGDNLIKLSTDNGSIIVTE